MNTIDQPSPGEMPIYQVTRALKPAQKVRHAFETPFSTIWDSDVWQYGERALAVGERVSTTAWPHSSMRPLNRSAEMILSFYNNEMKSRLPRSPFGSDGRLRLDNGLSNAPLQIDIARHGGVTPTPRRPEPPTMRRVW
jgi:hypothetical protein